MSIDEQIAKLIDERAEIVARRIVAETLAAQAPKDEELTVNQLCQIKQVSRRTVYDWVDKKRIPHHYTPGGQLRFYRRHVEAPLQEV